MRYDHTLGTFETAIIGTDGTLITDGFVVGNKCPGSSSLVWLLSFLDFPMDIRQIEAPLARPAGTRTWCKSGFNDGGI